MDRFDNVRMLAWQLDKVLGVAERKMILAGSEKLTYRAGHEVWSDWLSEVADRLERMLSMNAELRTFHKNSLRQLVGLIGAPEREL